MKGQKGQFPYESKVGKAFFYGRAIHEFIQTRLPYMREHEVKYITDDFIFNKTGFMVEGHIDCLDMENRTVLEFKTTSLEYVMPSRIKEYMLQAGAYAKLMELQTGKPFNANIFVINGTLTEYELTQEDIDNSLSIILQRAKETYEKLQFLGEIKN